MEQYPHTQYWDKSIPIGTHILAFDKKDGSNVRAEWQRKLSKKSNFTAGFAKFGTRTQLIERINQNFGDAVEYFDEKIADDLDKLFTDEPYFKKYDKITVFCEYWGEHSFAGQHEKTDIKTLTIIDLHLQKHGIISPYDFIKYLNNFDIADVIYNGELTQQFIDDIYNGVYPVEEGVMAKTTLPFGKSKKELTVMGKIKTKKWFDRLKEKYGEIALKKELLNL